MNVDESAPARGRVAHLVARLSGRGQRTLAERVARRPLRMQNRVPYVSFTFDDFPRSALRTGGEILRERGVRGTYYASFGLMGSQAPTGRMFDREDIAQAVAQGHELGCHTFSHAHAWRSGAGEFEREIVRNREALAETLPGAAFESLSFPIWVPRPAIKRAAARHFDACRCGGQTFNARVMDASLLRAFFIEKSRDDVDGIRRVIDAACRERGWLIFATHDVDVRPTAFGCTPETFAAIVDHATASGARVLPVAKALAEIAAP